MSVTINGTNGLTFNDASTQNTAATGFGFKNRIINGACMIDQRNAGASIAIDGNNVYTIDRWGAQDATDGAFTVQQVTTAPVGFNNSLKITVTTADASLGATQVAQIYQNIEGYNVADLGWGTANAKNITLSFWVQSSLTGAFGGCISNDGNSRSYPFTYTISAANTWEQKSVTIAGDTSGTWLTTNGVGLRLYIGLGAGSTYSGTSGAWASATYLSATGATSVVGTNGATFYITGVQLEKGSTATSFDYRPYGTELALCQRYYAKSYAQATKPGTASTYAGIMNNYVYAGGFCALAFRFPVSMRAIPTVTYYDIAGNSGKVYANGNNVTAEDMSAYFGTDGACYGQSSVLNTGVQFSAHYTASAEL